MVEEARGGYLLVDVVLYSGERDLLDARLDMLGADLTLVIEGDRTFTGTPRKVEPLPDTVRHIVIASDNDSDPWRNEYLQRRNGYKVLQEYDLPDDAVVGFFDVDEIPDPTLLRLTDRLSVWRMRKYQMSLAWYQRDEETGVSGLWGEVKNLDMARVRWAREQLPRIVGGYHLSSFLEVEDLLEKWNGFSHQEFQRDDMPAWIAYCWAEGVAIETGEPLREMSLEKISQRLLDGPAFWSRTRSYATPKI